MKKRRRIKVEVGSGNIFADLGLPDAEEHAAQGGSWWCSFTGSSRHASSLRLPAAKLHRHQAARPVERSARPLPGLFHRTADADAHRVRPGCRNHRAAAAEQEGQAGQDHVQRQGGVSGRPIGDRVFHQKFGNGNDTGVDGNKLTIAFDKAGEKRVADTENRCPLFLAALLSSAWWSAAAWTRPTTGSPSAPAVVTSASLTISGRRGFAPVRTRCPAQRAPELCNSLRRSPWFEACWRSAR